MKNPITEIKNVLEGINSRITEAEELISKHGDRMVEKLLWSTKKKKRMKRNEDSLKHFWDNIKCTNIRIIGVAEEKKEKESEKIFEEITVKTFPKMGKKNSHSSPGNAESSIQDKANEKH